MTQLRDKTAPVAHSDGRLPAAAQVGHRSRLVCGPSRTLDGVKWNFARDIDLDEASLLRERADSGEADDGSCSALSW